MPSPKQNMLRIPALTKLARGQTCTLMLDHGAGHPVDTVVWCHSNFSWHGKGKSMKAHDIFGMFGCAHCHHILDQGRTMTRADRERATAVAMRSTRMRLFNQRLIDTTLYLDGKSRAVNDDDFWLECWRNGSISVGNPPREKKRTRSSKMLPPVQMFTEAR